MEVLILKINDNTVVLRKKNAVAYVSEGLINIAATNGSNTRTGFSTDQFYTVIVKNIPENIMGRKIIISTPIDDDFCFDLKFYTLDESDDTIKYSKKMEDLAYNEKLKEEVRDQFEGEVGDFLDQLADTDQKSNVIVGMVLRLYNLVVKGIPIPTDLNGVNVKKNYDDFTTIFTELIDTGQYQDTADVQNTESLVEKLITNEIVKGAIYKKYLEDKRTIEE